jgi:hypothetical protein
MNLYKRNIAVIAQICAACVSCKLNRLHDTYGGGGGAQGGKNTRYLVMSSDLIDLWSSLYSLVMQSFMIFKSEWKYTKLTYIDTGSIKSSPVNQSLQFWQ